MKTVSVKTPLKTLCLVLLLSGFSFTLQAQSKQHKTNHMKTEKMQPKDHVCTSACSNGQHMYAHGEKGHVCTDECKKMDTSKMKNKKG